jgi:hypothetical protein
VALRHSTTWLTRGTCRRVTFYAAAAFEQFTCFVAFLHCASGPEALDNLADKGDMQVGCTAGRGGGGLSCSCKQLLSLRVNLFCSAVIAHYHKAR